MITPTTDRSTISFQVSITFDPFMYLTLPIPVTKKWKHVVEYIPWDLSQPHVKVEVLLAI